MNNGVIPGFTTKFIDERTGLNSREWYRYFDTIQGAGIIVAIGRVGLVAGTATVLTPFANISESEIFLSNISAGGTPGILSVGTVSINTSFVIDSTSPTDTSTVSWMIVRKIVRN